MNSRVRGVRGGGLDGGGFEGPTPRPKCTYNGQENPKRTARDRRRHRRFDLDDDFRGLSPVEKLDCIADELDRLDDDRRDAFDLDQISRRGGKHSAPPLRPPRHRGW